uniref:Uncharacterized protein n=1 Tax=Anguilla anguilla TaxID=7936 RepID=A0A0E9TGX6_ANGAN
MSLLQKHL